MVTLRTPKAWPGRAARWFRSRVYPQFVPDVSSGAKSRLPQVAGVGLVLFVLIGLTTLAVAWVCIWWVPAYLALMVCIFAVPHGHGRPERVIKSNQRSSVSTRADVGQDLQANHVTEEVYDHLATGLISGPMTGESAIENGVSHLDLTNSGAARGRRTRSRTRKTVKTAAADVPESGSVSVTWIRVGPGKFVRAEGGSETVDPAQDGKVSVDHHVVADGFAQELPASLALANSLVAEDYSPESLEQNPGDEGRSVGSEDCMTDMVTEVYGIAPSTFGTITSDLPSVEGLEGHAPEPGISLDSAYSPVPEVSNGRSADNVDRQAANLGRTRVGRRVYGFSQRIANTIRRGNRASLRCNVRKGLKVRLPIRSSPGLDGRLEQALRRIFGRVAHTQRALRPRSPPSS